ncbi:flavodoxin domain-containing protein [uncultured Vagococcus sp.]|uniref:flavodoxin domain-containing protein n=1 Tax=uncultured Vagococcus sp. TaxID=189676 RepID=UPI0028D0D453|nr:flavodoxin domain-containing protein [uncultured Vagococcus sp.]
MKTLIIYGTKSGASEECAKLLSQLIEDSRIANVEVEQPELADFERVIVGAGVRNDKMYKPIRDYLKKQEAHLLTKELACFLCHSKPKTTEEVIVASIPEGVRQGAVEIMAFGGYKPNWVPVSPANKLKGIDQEKIAEFVSKLS